MQIKLVTDEEGTVRRSDDRAGAKSGAGADSVPPSASKSNQDTDPSEAEPLAGDAAGTDASGAQECTGTILHQHFPALSLSLYISLSLSLSFCLSSTP